MALPPNQNHSFRLLALSLFSSFGLGMMLPAAAHNVEVSGNVAATMHLEPSHNPKAGEPALVWFALTQQGGELVPLEQCNCRLAIYREPRSSRATPLLQPVLKPIDAERYQGIPGSEVTFPQSGIYIMALSGSPKAGANFQPFELTYSVTVTAGSARPATQASAAQLTPINTISASQPETDAGMPVWQMGAIASVLAIGLGIGVSKLNYKQRK
ncbi:MAG TPA: hypothetical protein V6C64_02620 [Microcoleaceae cyanobacterium]|jgi:hypothetical protein